MVPDSLLGFHLAEGDFAITINDGHTYFTEHRNGQRNYTAIKEDRPIIYLMGCSFTYGMGVDDDETFTALLQKDTNVNFLNFGVPGYGTVQSILQLENEVQKGHIPDMVILNFSYHHFERNALTPKYRKDLTLGYARSTDLSKFKMQKARFPFVHDDKINWCAWGNLYENWWGRETFAVINYLNTIVDQRKINEQEIIDITKHLFSRIHEFCADNSIVLKVCFLDDSHRNLQLQKHCSHLGIDYKKVGLDYTSTSLTNLPFDSHPNSAGHEKIALKIKPWINSIHHLK